VGHGRQGLGLLHFSNQLYVGRPVLIAGPQESLLVDLISLGWLFLELTMPLSSQALRTYRFLYRRTFDSSNPRALCSLHNGIWRIRKAAWFEVGVRDTCLDLLAAILLAVLHLVVCPVGVERHLRLHGLGDLKSERASRIKQAD